MESFNDLEIKHGCAVANQILVEIEKASKIQSWAVAHLDPEIRLANAIKAQDAVINRRLVVAHFADEAVRCFVA